MIDIQNKVAIWFHQENDNLLVEIRCAACGNPPEKVKGASDKADLLYMLNCPKCNKTLVEYKSPEELSAELAKIVEKWRV